jgi:hypothetical protein
MIARAAMLGLALGAFSLIPVTSPDLPRQLLPVYGGAGGNAFTRSCGEGKVLTGLRFRAGLLVDAIGIMCRPVLANGTLGPESTSGTLVGGSGGGAGALSCPAGMVSAGALIRHGSFVDKVSLLCKTWNASSRAVSGSLQNSRETAGNSQALSTNDSEACEAPTQPVNGIRGRANSVVDAIGFICDEP